MKKITTFHSEYINVLIHYCVTWTISSVSVKYIYLYSLCNSSCSYHSSTHSSHKEGHLKSISCTKCTFYVTNDDIICWHKCILSIIIDKRETCALPYIKDHNKNQVLSFIRRIYQFLPFYNHYIWSLHDNVIFS